MPLFDEPNNVNELIQPTAARTATKNYAFGGYNQFGFSNLARNISDNTATKLPYRFAGAQAVYFPPNGRIYIFGGMNYDGFLDTVFEFNPLNGSIRGMSAKLPEKNNRAFRRIFLRNRQNLSVRRKYRERSEKLGFGIQPADRHYGENERGSARSDCSFSGSCVVAISRSAKNIHHRGQRPKRLGTKLHNRI